MRRRHEETGAVDFLTKPAVDDEELLAAVSRAVARSVEVRKAGAVRAAARALLDALTPREFEVMQRVIAGLLNKQIADDLGAAEKTIRKIHSGPRNGEDGCPPPRGRPGARGAGGGRGGGARRDVRPMTAISRGTSLIAGTRP